MHSRAYMQDGMFHRAQSQTYQSAIASTVQPMPMQVMQPQVLSSSGGYIRTMPTQQAPAPVNVQSLRQQINREHQVEQQMHEKAGHGTANEAIMIAHTMHSEIQMMETTIYELQQDNEALKFRLLQQRRSSLEKYFMADGRLLLQGTLREWDRLTQEMKRMRELDGVNAMRSRDLALFEAEIAELERQAAALEQELSNATKETQDLGGALADAEKNFTNQEQEQGQLLQRVQALEEALRQEREQENEARLSEEMTHAQLQRAEKVIKLVGDVSTSYTTHEAPRVEIATTGEKIMKDNLHNILKETDPNYVPPLDKLHQVANPVIVEKIIAAPQPVMVETLAPVQAPRPMTFPTLPQTMPMREAPQMTQVMTPQGLQTIGGAQIMRRELATAAHGAYNQPLTMRSPR